MNIKSEDIVIAIGVCANAADLAYDSRIDKQSPKWEELRAAVYHLTSILEEVAKSEVAL